MSETCWIQLSKRASPLLKEMAHSFMKGCTPSLLPTFLLALELDEYGRDETLYELLRRGFDPEGKRGAILVRSSSDLYTKTILTEHIHLLNTLGMIFPGSPYVEAIEDLRNVRNLASRRQISPEKALFEKCKELGERVSTFQLKPLKKLLVIHANSHPERSNTMSLFRRVEKYLEGIEVSVEIIKEDVRDCRGCSYTSCGYYQQDGGCFYGSVFHEAFLEKVLHYDAILWLAPNYNDALSAKIMAIINRFSALYKKAPFYDKSLYAIIVSGNSGSDSVARQLIGSLCLNKGFSLPACFYIQQIANDPGEIEKLADFDLLARKFAGQLNDAAGKKHLVHAVDL